MLALGPKQLASSVYKLYPSPSTTKSLKRGQLAEDALFALTSSLCYLGAGGRHKYTAARLLGAAEVRQSGDVSEISCSGGVASGE